MNIWVVSLFPDFINAFKSCGVIGQVLEGKRKSSLELNFHVIDLREFSTTKYKGVDDSPFGGGPGMVMKADILLNALENGIWKPSQKSKNDFHVVYTSPRGVVWNRDECHRFSNQLTQLNSQGKDIVFICGRYEGIDERFLQLYIDEYISVGDYVLTGGELAVLTILDSSLRLSPGVLGNQESHMQDSFEQGLIEYPQYTRPRDFQGLSIPDALVSGDHKRILEFQKQEQLRLTQKHRPDLIEKLKEKNNK